MDRKIMTATTMSKPAEVSAFSFIGDAIKGFRRSRLRAAQRKHLLSLDDHMLRDMGLTRLDVLHGDF
jgi:uncharacterized protein YjiS (DUF1127 family)